MRLKEDNTVMRIRITRKPVGHIEGIDVSSLQVGTIYEVSHELASALLLLGYARVEMRRIERRSKGRTTADRRVKLETSFR
jgi:hypothetical protein